MDFTAPSIGGKRVNAEKLTQYLESLLITYNIPSVDCVVYKEHNEIYRHMCGTVDETRTVPVSKDQRYLMFSMTKVQTMTCIMQLVEKGMLSLEDEVSKYLPAYKDLKVEQNGKVTKSNVPMLIKHLVSMQSGLNYNLDRPGILRVLKEKGTAATTRELVDAFVETPLDFEPGTDFCYSLSHDVAAAVIEVVSGMSYGEYLKKNLWEPLEMTDTFFAKPQNDNVERLARQYIAGPDGIVVMDQSCCYQLSDNYESGGAGLISCTMDYAKLADALANGGMSAKGVRILKAETVEQYKKSLLCAKSVESMHRTMGRPAYEYGIGMQIFLYPELVGSKAPKGIFGWDGACASAVMMDTASKTSVVFTMHVRNFGVAYDIIHPMIRDLVFS